MNKKSFSAAMGAIILWSMLAAISTRLCELPPLFLTGSALMLGGSLSIIKIRSWSKNWSFIFVGAIAIFSNHFLLFTALRIAPPVESNLINYLWPLLIVLLSPFFDHHVHLKWIQITGITLGFLGAALAIGIGTSGHLVDPHFGYLLAFIAALIWACFSLLLRRHTDVSAPSIGLICLIGGFFSITASLLLNEKVVFTSSNFIYLLLMGLGPMGFAFYLWTFAIKKGEPQKVASLSYLTPILSTAWLSLAIGTPLSSRIFFALVLVIGGAVLVQMESIHIKHFKKWHQHLHP